MRLAIYRVCPHHLFKRAVLSPFHFFSCIASNRQALLAGGHVLYLIYTVHYGLWPLYTVQFFDLALILLMIALKVYYDRGLPSKSANPRIPTSQSRQGKVKSCTLSIRPRRSLRKVTTDLDRLLLNHVVQAVSGAYPLEIPHSNWFHAVEVRLSFSQGPCVCSAL